jgi:hypothetical protein
LSCTADFWEKIPKKQWRQIWSNLPKYMDALARHLGQHGGGKGGDMWQHEREIRTEGDNPNFEEPWPCAETLTTLTELNEQCLELLSEQAKLGTSPSSPILRELGDLWSQLDINSRRRAAACPYLLLDAGFADPYRWRWVGGHGVGEREPAPYSSFFTANDATRVAHQIFTNAWYIVRTQPIGAPLYLGMPAHCATLLRACTVRQVTELANQHAGWLRPRWTGRVKVWRELLLAAISGEGVALERARMHGVQLLAMELKALEQVHANERK